MEVAESSHGMNLGGIQTGSDGGKSAYSMDFKDAPCTEGALYTQYVWDALWTDWNIHY